MGIFTSRKNGFAKDIFLLYLRRNNPRGYNYYHTMLQTAFLLFFSLVFLLLPLLFWSYVSSTFFEYTLWRVHFFMGIFLWTFVTVVLLAAPWVWYEIGISRLFLALSHIGDISGFFGYIFWLSLLCGLALVFFFSLSYFFQNDTNIFVKRFLWSACIFFLFILICAGISYFLALFFSQEMIQEIFSWLILSSLWIVLAYYITLAFIEEIGKYTASLTFSGRQEALSFAGTLLVGVCIALWFSLFENLVYSYFYYQRIGVSGALLQFIILRSIFSTTLHVLASLLVSYGFWYIFSTNRYFSRVFLFVFLGFWLHSVFNIMLGFWHVFFLIIPLFWAYVFLSGLSSNVKQY